MRSVQHGLLAGGLAGLLLGGLLFIDEGPGNQLAGVAQALSFAGSGASRGVVAGLVLVLGVLLGGGFGALLRRKPVPRWRALLLAVALGAGWWVLMLLGGVVRQLSFSLYPLLLALVLSLLYGIILGSLYTTLQRESSFSEEEP
jgi:hypothetical protein